MFLKRESVVLSLLIGNREHPGISRIFNEPPGITVPHVIEDGEMWSQSWKPRKVAEVLGNEDNALYLKGWLQALALGTRDRTRLGGAGATAEEEKSRRNLVWCAVWGRNGGARDGG